MSDKTKKRLFLGAIAGIISSVFTKFSRKPTASDLSNAEFKTSTQKLGLRFNERIRRAFRGRWIRKVR